LVSPETVAVGAQGQETTTLRPLGDATTVYLVIGAWLSCAGDVHRTVACPLPAAVAVTCVGAAGTVGAGAAEALAVNVLGI
jgi:hypothetical protein